MGRHYCSGNCGRYKDGGYLLFYATLPDLTLRLFLIVYSKNRGYPCMSDDVRRWVRCSMQTLHKVREVQDMPRKDRLHWLLCSWWESLQVLSRSVALLRKLQEVNDTFLAQNYAIPQREMKRRKRKWGREEEGKRRRKGQRWEREIKERRGHRRQDETKRGDEEKKICQ